MMRILLTGGGTAGHINPAIAIADTIKRNCKEAEVAFVGTPEGMERRLVKEAGYPFFPVRVQGFQRSLTLKNVQAAWLALTSPRAAAGIISEFQPSLVIGTGGYVCWPLLRAAARMGIPAALHESNAVPGLATRRLAPYMDAIWLNFKETANALPAHCVSPLQVGNPLRHGFSSVSRTAARRELGLCEQDFMILSFGGSRGAEALNDAILHFIKSNLPRHPQLYHVHACGEKHYEACRKVLGEKKTARCVLLPYISKMDTYMSAADIVVCRAGAMTISELALCGKCAILVPSPHVAGDHQRKNAELLVKSGAACLLEEDDLPQNKLGNLIFSLLKNEKERFSMQKKIKKFATPDANSKIYQQILLLAEKTKADQNC